VISETTVNTSVVHEVYGQTAGAFPPNVSVLYAATSQYYVIKRFVQDLRSVSTRPGPLRYLNGFELTDQPVRPMPVRPTLRLKNLPGPFKPGSKWSKAKIVAMRLKYERRHDAVVSLRSAQLAKYNLRLAAFEERLKHYYVYLRRRARGFKKVSLRQNDRPWTAYYRRRTSDTGLAVSYEAVQYSLIMGQHFPSRRDVIYGVQDVAPPNLPGAVISENLYRVEQRAIAKLHAKVRNAQVHLGNLIAEREQTAGLLVSAFKALALFLNKKKFLEAVTSDVSPKELADATLAFQFGVRPLIADLQTAVKAYQNQLEKARFYVRCRAVDTMEYQWHEADTFIPGYGLGYPQPPGDYVSNLATTATVSYTYEFAVSDGLLNSLSQWGLVNPLETVWESLPWSFIVDWLIPVGNWISSLTSEQGLQFVRGVRVTTITNRYSTGYFPNADVAIGGGYVHQQGSFERAFNDVTKERVLLTSVPPFELALKSPLSLDHTIDVLALAVQLRRNS